MKPKKYDYIKLCMGYPRKDETGKILWRMWNGIKKGYYETDLFGYKYVFAIDVNTPIFELCGNQFLTPDLKGKKVLVLNLHKKYWIKIRDYEKPLEYREIKPHWQKRLFLEGK